MAKKKSFEELVQLKQNGEIGWLEFVNMGDSAEDYARWCEEHSTMPSEDSAELFVEMTEERLFENIDDLL